MLTFLPILVWDMARRIDISENLTSYVLQKTEAMMDEEINWLARSKYIGRPGAPDNIPTYCCAYA